MSADHAEPIVLVQSLSRRSYEALEARQFDEALALLTEAKAQVEQAIAAAWAQKRRALG